MTDELETTAPTGLTAEQEKAAMLDAQGESRKAIAKVCDVTPKTISVWRASPLYRQEKDRIRQDMADELEARTTNVKMDLLEAVSEAVQTMREALKAERDDGTPEWGTRARAAEALMGKAKFVYEAEGGQAGTAAAAAVITVNLGTDGTPQVIEGNVING